MHIFNFCAFSWRFLCLKWPEYSAGVLSRVPERRMRGCASRRKRVFDKPPPSGVSDAAVGHELHANESTTNIKLGVFKPEHT